MYAMWRWPQDLYDTSDTWSFSETQIPAYKGRMQYLGHRTEKNDFIVMTHFWYVSLLRFGFVSF